MPINQQKSPVSNSEHTEEEDDESMSMSASASISKHKQSIEQKIKEFDLKKPLEPVKEEFGKSAEPRAEEWRLKAQLIDEQ